MWHHPVGKTYRNQFFQMEPQKLISLTTLTFRNHIIVTRKSYTLISCNKIYLDINNVMLKWKTRFLSSPPGILTYYCFKSWKCILGILSIDTNKPIIYRSTQLKNSLFFFFFSVKIKFYHIFPVSGVNSKYFL